MNIFARICSSCGASFDSCEVGSPRAYTPMRLVSWRWHWILMRLILLFMMASSAGATTNALNAMRIDTFDSLDAASFCDARRFDNVEGISGIIYSHSPYYPVSIYRPGRDCFMTLRAPVGYRLELTALEFQVGERFAPHTRKCAGDSLHIFDQDKPDPAAPKKVRSHPPASSDYYEERVFSSILSNSSVTSPIKANLCGRLKNNTVIARSTLNVMTLWWHSEPIPSSPSSASNVDRLSVSAIAKRGFKLQWTAFRESGVSGCDTDKEFACGTQNMCIPMELACDNVGHCTDRSDLSSERQRAVGCEGIEPEPVTSSTFNVGTMAGICIGVLLLIVLAIVFISICRKRHGLSRRQQHKYNQAPVTTATTSSMDNHFGNDRYRNGSALVTNSGKNSSDSSNSDGSRCQSSSTNDSRNHRLQQQQFNGHGFQAHQLTQQQYLQQIDSNDSMGVRTQNGAYYQPYYPTESGPYQPKLHYHYHHHHHPPPPPPSMVGDQVARNYYPNQQENSRHPIIA